MTRRLFVAFLVLATGVLLLHDFLRSGESVTAERRGAVIGLERKAFQLALYAQDDLEPDEVGPNRLVNSQAHRIARRAGAIAVVTDRRGNLIEIHPRSTVPALRRLAVRSGDAVRRLGRTRSEVVHLGGTAYEVVAVPVAANRGVIGSVVMIERSEVLDRSERDRLGFLTPTFLVAVLVSALGAWVFARLLTRPLEQLVAATRRVARDGNGAPSVEPRGTRETRELAEAFNAMSVRVRDLVDRQRSFASDVSHQLRTPVTTIGVALDNADGRLRTGDAAGARTSLSLARSELDRMHHLVEGLLVLTRVSLADAPRDVVDLGAVVRDRVATWSALAEERGIDLVAAVDGPQPVLVVAGALEQVIDNLVDNALTVAPDGTAVVLAVERRGGGRVLTVRDHGPGMTEAERARAFDRFWRGTGADEDGLGLGLTIVHDLVYACRGDVALEAPADGGLRVVVTLEAATGPGDDGTGGGPDRSGALPGGLADYLRERDPARAAAVGAAVEHELGEDGAPDADGTVHAFVAARDHLDPIDLAADAALLEAAGGLDTGQIAAVLGVSPREVRGLLRRARRTRAARRDTAAKVGALAFGLVVAGAGTAAATGSLPAPLQRGVARTLDSVGVSVPDPADRPSSGRAHRPSPGDATVGGTRTTGSVDTPAMEGQDPTVVPDTTPTTSATGGSGPATGSGTGAGKGAGNGAGNGGGGGTGATNGGGNGGSPPGQGRGNGAGAANGNGAANGVGNGGTPPGQSRGNGGGAANGNGNGAATANGSAPTTGKGNGNGGNPPGQAKKDSAGAATAPGANGDGRGNGNGGTPPGRAKR